MPTEEELVDTGQRVRPIMKEILDGKGLIELTEDKVYVTKLRDRSRTGGRKRWRASLAAYPADRALKAR